MRRFAIVEPQPDTGCLRVLDHAGPIMLVHVMIENRSVCVYCGSQAGQRPDYMEAARVVGRALAESRIRLIYGGGTHGIMGTVAEAVIQHGGLVTGIIPGFLKNRGSGGERPTGI